MARAAQFSAMGLRPRLRRRDAALLAAARLSARNGLQTLQLSRLIDVLSDAQSLRLKRDETKDFFMRIFDPKVL